MKQLLLVISLAIILLSGCTQLEEKKADKIINTYYNAMINKNYSKAFKVLHVYDNDSFKYSETALSSKELKKAFLHKTDYQEGPNYKITGFKILEVEYEDSHSFWHHVEVQGVSIDGDFIVEDVATNHDGKLSLTSDTDSYINYRDGFMYENLIK